MSSDGQRIPGMGIGYEISHLTSQITIRVDAEEMMFNAEAKHAVAALVAIADAAREQAERTYPIVRAEPTR